MHLLQFCLGQNADAICIFTTAKPGLPQQNAAVSARLISAKVMSGHCEDFKRLLFALFEKAVFGA